MWVNIWWCVILRVDDCFDWAFAGVLQSDWIVGVYYGMKWLAFAVGGISLGVLEEILVLFDFLVIEWGSVIFLML